MVLSSFVPVSKNTIANAAVGITPVFGLSDSNAILTAYTQPSDIGAGLGKFSATFNIVPASWDDFQSMPFLYPCFAGVEGFGSSRFAFTDVAMVRVHYDYFVEDPSGVLAGHLIYDSGGNAVIPVISLSVIPIIPKSKFCPIVSGVVQKSVRTNNLVKSGGWGSYYETVPNVELYQAWMVNANTSSWASSAWDGISTTAGTVGQIVAEDSKIVPYAGNIVARVTTYILAR